MRELNAGIRALSLLTLGIAAAAGGCYGTPRTSFPDEDAGGDATDAAGCPAICAGPTTGPTTGSGACVDNECRIACNSTYPTLCAASNACVDLMSDGKHCGTCGHDCLGGSCAAGECQPVLIAQYIGNPMILYVGAQAVYITTDLGYVGRASKNGGDLKPAAMPGFASSAYYGTLLAEDGDRVFLARYGGQSAFRLSYCLVSGCDSTATPIGGDYTQHFAVDQADHRIVWVDYSPARLMSIGTIGTAPGLDLPGGKLPTGSNGGRLLYANGGIYFADGSSVKRIPIAGGSIATITSSTAPLVVLGTNNTSLFVYDGSAIGSVPLPSGDGASPTVLVTGSLDTGIDGHFAADDDSMYWVTSGQISTCQIAGCSGTRKLLPKRAIDLTWDIAIDGEAIYAVADSGLSESGTKICTVSTLAR